MNDFQSAVGTITTGSSLVGKGSAVDGPKESIQDAIAKASQLLEELTDADARLKGLEDRLYGNKRPQTDSTGGAEKEPPKPEIMRLMELLDMVAWRVGRVACKVKDLDERL